MIVMVSVAGVFLSTLSLRRATVLRAVSSSLVIFLSTLSLRRATRPLWLQSRLAVISIHALLAESDAQKRYHGSPPADFYPRSPCGERRPPAGKRAGCYHFYPRSPCGERRRIPQNQLSANGISIHALLAESDALVPHQQKSGNRFLSTLSLRRATLVNMRSMLSPVFLSTLSLRRATLVNKLFEYIQADFYPRSPCGERPPPAPQGESSKKFLSTLSLRRATKMDPVQVPGYTISIHALLAESDLFFIDFNLFMYNFYPRSPCGERRQAIQTCRA